MESTHLEQKMPPILMVENLTKFFASNAVIEGISFDLYRGEIMGLVGPSGSGKSVLLKLLGGVYKQDLGKISYSFQRSSAEELSAQVKISPEKIGIAFQEGALFDSLTVIENVAFPLRSMGADSFSEVESPAGEQRDKMWDAAHSMLQRVGLGKHAGKYPGQLSGGMRRRVAIARALVARPSLALLDDPTAGLDPVTSTQIIELVKELRQTLGSTVIVASHDIHRLLPNVNKVMAIFGGRLLAFDEPGKLPETAPSRVIDFLSKRFKFN